MVEGEPFAGFDEFFAVSNVSPSNPHVHPLPPLDHRNLPLRGDVRDSQTIIPRQHLGTQPSRLTSLAFGVGAATAIIALVILGLFQFGKTLSTEEIVSQAESSVAFIEGRFTSGTGFVVRPGVIVTNRHVVEAELINRIKVHFASAVAGQRGPFTAELLYTDPERDLAFLSVNTSLSPLRLAPQHSFRRGQEVIVIGNPGVTNELVLQNAISRGVLSTQATINGQEYYQLGISINAGNSGGPVLDTSGQVIGVVTLKASEQEGLGFCVPLSELTSAVARLDTLSPQEIATARSQHRLRVVFAFVNVTGERYKTGMQIYASAMEIALSQGSNADTGLEAVRGDVERKLLAYDQLLVGDLKREVSKIAADASIPEVIRQRFVDLWTNDLELKSYVDDPRGNYDSYKAKYHILSDNHDRLSESLKLLLGANTSE